MRRIVETAPNHQDYGVVEYTINGLTDHVVEGKTLSYDEPKTERIGSTPIQANYTRDESDLNGLDDAMVFEMLNKKTLKVAAVQEKLEDDKAESLRMPLAYVLFGLILLELLLANLRHKHAEPVTNEA